MANYGMFHGATHGKKHGKVHGVNHGTLHGIDVTRGLVHGAPWSTPWFIYSMTPDDASVDISSMGQPRKKTFPWHIPWSPMARSKANAMMTVAMVTPLVHVPWHIP